MLDFIERLTEVNVVDKKVLLEHVGVVYDVLQVPKLSNGVFVFAESLLHSAEQAIVLCKRGHFLCQNVRVEFVQVVGQADGPVVFRRGNAIFFG